MREGNTEFCADPFSLAICLQFLKTKFPSGIYDRHVHSHCHRTGTIRKVRFSKTATGCRQRTREISWHGLKISGYLCSHVILEFSCSNRRKPRKSLRYVVRHASPVLPVGRWEAADSARPRKAVFSCHNRTNKQRKCFYCVKKLCSIKFLFTAKW